MLSSFLGQRAGGAPTKRSGCPQLQVPGLPPGLWGQPARWFLCSAPSPSGETEVRSWELTCSCSSRVFRCRAAEGEQPSFPPCGLLWPSSPEPADRSAKAVSTKRRPQTPLCPGPAPAAPAPPHPPTPPTPATNPQGAAHSCWLLFGVRTGRALRPEPHIRTHTHLSTRTVSTVSQFLFAGKLERPWVGLELQSFAIRSQPQGPAQGVCPGVGWTSPVWGRDRQRRGKDSLSCPRGRQFRRYTPAPRLPSSPAHSRPPHPDRPCASACYEPWKHTAAKGGLSGFWPLGRTRPGASRSEAGYGDDRRPISFPNRENLRQ